MVLQLYCPPLPLKQMVVSFSSFVQLNSSGLWAVKILTTASSRTTWVWINGLQVPINAATQTGIFLSNATGGQAPVQGQAWLPVSFSHVRQLYSHFHRLVLV
jgi:hypothetical protein